MKYSCCCSCGAIQVELHLPKPLTDYTPRACDCDFCTERKVSYISDSEATLQITNPSELKLLRQGSGQADFWQCKSCHDLIAVTRKFEDGLKGCVNAQLLSENHKLRKPLSVSPKLLSHKEKLERWREVWMSVEFKS